MSKPAIVIENLGKQYKIGLREKADRTFREAIVDTLAAPLRRLRTLGEKSVGDDTIWALRDVSFEVHPGEVVGIIGPNGAGKTTLLKILSRITEPTEGQVRLRGRVASLLEVGTGFHRELTGRENIYLNGAILGMKRAEIDRKFDEIVDFAGVEKFIDTPIKRYSSGMYVRLAFAVAAHLEPEILLVDEVLAVGDAEFQRKCLGKMGQAAGHGRTVLFVSHNMTAIQNLCRRALVLNAGQVQYDGETSEAISRYIVTSQRRKKTTRSSIADFREPGRHPLIQEVNLFCVDGKPTNRVAVGGPISIEIRYAYSKPLKSPTFGIVVDTPDAQRMFFLQTRLQHSPIVELPAEGRVVCHVASVPLIPGTYMLSFGCSLQNTQVDRLDRAIELHVDPADYFGTGRLPTPPQGRIVVDANWEIS